MADQTLRIAVIGGGAAGIAAAHVLQQRHEVVLFERNDYVGGHAHTIVIPDGPDAGTPVDTGFIVLNDRTYPTLHRLFAQLGVELRNTEMSFSFHDERTGFHYAGTNLRGLFAQPHNLWSPSFWSMLWEIGRFCRQARADLRDETGVVDLTLGDYLQRNRFAGGMVDRYAVPMAASIWSSRPADITAFPALAFLRFFSNHGLLSLSNRPRWQSVVGGSHRYVQNFLDAFRGTVYRGTEVVRVERTHDGARVHTGGGEEVRVERVVLATHADEALRLLADSSDEERRLLEPWRYQRNHTVLHTDTSALPPNPRAWACWNFVREAQGQPGQEPVSVTYSMNRLQGLRTSRHYCVSLNRHKPVAPGSVISEMEYTHPTYTFASMATQKDLPGLNGQRNTYFCGSYFGYGFHEDAVRSGVEVGRAFGLEL